MMTLLDELVVEKCVNSVNSVLIKEQNQVEKLVKVFESFLGEQDYFFQQQQRYFLNQIVAKHKQLDLMTFLQELANTDNEFMIGHKKIAEAIWSEKRGINKLAFLIL